MMGIRGRSDLAHSANSVETEIEMASRQCASIAYDMDVLMLEWSDRNAIKQTLSGSHYFYCKQLGIQCPDILRSAPRFAQILYLA
ncbi:protein of unknown function [Pararobbsia alpina]